MSEIREAEKILKDLKSGHMMDCPTWQARRLGATIADALETFIHNEVLNERQSITE